MKKNYTHSGFINRIKESIKNESANAISLKSPRWSRLLLFTATVSMMPLFMGTSIHHQNQDISQEAYVLSDIDGSNEKTINTQLHFSEKKESSFTKEIPHTTVQMGFSFFGTWDFLISRFTAWFGEEEEEAEIEAENQVQAQASNQTKSIMFDCPGGTAPTVTAFALSSSCTDGIPNDDGYLQISAASDATHYDFTLGSTYTGNGFVDGTAFDPATNLPLQFGTLANPAVATDYTIRIFNGEDACFTDVIVTMNEQDCAVGCDCEEYIYLNEERGEGAVHKFLVNADSTLTEIGSPWYPGEGTSELPAPHGLAIDLNGFLYIGATFADDGNIRKLNCNGDIFPESEFAYNPPGVLHNFGSANGILYSRGDNEEIISYDFCTGQEGKIILTDHSGSDGWGFHIDPNTGTFYVTDARKFNRVNVANRVNHLWKFNPTPDDFINNTSFSPMISEPSAGSSNDNTIDSSNEPSIGDNWLPDGSVHGVTTDIDGNIYIAIQNKIIKYDSTGVFLGESLEDNVAGVADADGNYGYNRPFGIIYAQSTGLIYVTSNTNTDDCVSVFDTSLNYLGAVAGPTFPDEGQGKGMSIAEECCPTNNNIRIDTTLCVASINDQLFLQDLINCDSPICEGLWQEGASNVGLTYNSCNNSITPDALGACGAFTLSSDGTGSNAKCGAFTITVNVCFETLPTAPAIAVTDNDCNANTPGVFTVTTACGAGSTIEWSTDNGTTWSTTSPTYDNENTQTVIARCTNDVENTCISAESASVTSMPENCCPDPNCFNITIQQN